MSFPRYPAYKDSGVEWLGEAPEHWNRTALKFLGDYQNGYPFKPEDRGDDGLPIIRISQLTGDDEPAYFSGELDERVRVGDGDLLFSWSATIDSFIWNRGQAWLNQHIFRVSPSTEANKLYLYYAIKHVAPKLADFDAHGSTMRHIKKESLGERVYVPPVQEQSLIANFLDRETAKIDALIAEQQRLIELLQEKRQAVISHAVTKGLNPDAQMKDSGVEWLGEVPEHWGVSPLRWAAECCSGDGLSSTEVETIGDDEHTVQVIGGNGLMGFTDQKNVDHSLLAIGRVGALCGNVHIVHPPAWITDNALVLDPNSSIFDLEFLSLTLRSRNLNDIASKTAQPLITGTQVSDQRIPCPPLSEQQVLASHLTQLSAQFDTLTTEAQRAIDLLQERRSALISAAVTGQIDVRGLVPTEAPP